MPTIERLLIDRTSGTVSMNLYEVRQHKQTTKTWKMVIADEAPFDLDTYVEIWFSEFAPAMLVLENIYRHGGFNGDQALAKAIKAEENPHRLVRICGTQDLNKAHCARIAETESEDT